jgi:hypothetical protein
MIEIQSLDPSFAYTNESIMIYIEGTRSIYHLSIYICMYVLNERQYFETFTHEKSVYKRNKYQRLKK